MSDVLDVLNNLVSEVQIMDEVVRATLRASSLWKDTNPWLLVNSRADFALALVRKAI